MLLKKAKSFILAILSFIRWGDAPLDLYDKRRAVCARCPHMRATPQGLFCRACECPRWPISDLRTKWRLRDLRCPLHKW